MKKGKKMLMFLSEELVINKLMQIRGGDESNNPHDLVTPEINEPYSDTDVDILDGLDHRP